MQQLPHHPHPDADPVTVLEALAAEAGTTYEELVGLLADRAEEAIAFPYPPSSEDRQLAAALLRSGHDCQVGKHMLYSDGEFIETDDAYGCPAIWSEESAPEDALLWVDRQYAYEEAERRESAE